MLPIRMFEPRRSKADHWSACSGKEGRTKTTGRNVRGNENRGATSLELAQYPITLTSRQQLDKQFDLENENMNSLFLVSMNRKSRPAILTKIFCDVVCNSLCPDEDQHLGILSTNLIKMLDQLCSLLEITADFNDLLDVVIGGQLHRSDVDLNHVFQEILENASAQREIDDK